MQTLIFQLEKCPWREHKENLLDKKNIKWIKTEICNWNITNCSAITKHTIEAVFEQCEHDEYCLENEDVFDKDAILPNKYNPQNESNWASQKFVDMTVIFWAEDKYWRSDKLLEYMVYKAFNAPLVDDADIWIKRDAASEITYVGMVIGWYGWSDVLQLTFKDPTISPILPFYLWHLFQGHPLSEHDQYISMINYALSNYGDDLYGLNVEPIRCLEGPDWNSQACNKAQDFFNLFNQSTIQMFESWIDQPKVHGDEYEDYVLVPLCSIAEEPLSECDLFKPSKFIGQDQKCFTYDQSIQTNVGPSNGINFLLNLQNMPHDRNDEPLSVDLYLHEAGSYPDVFKVKSFPTPLFATERIIKIGVELTTQESTKNFEAMPQEKRKCKLSSLDKKYSRVNCAVDIIHETAMEQCGCVPRIMKPQSRPICDLNGAMCFRNVTKIMKDNFNQSLCLLECNTISYDADKRVEDYLDIWKYGQEYSDYLWRNPIGKMINDFDHDLDYYIHNMSAVEALQLDNLDVEDSGKRYSIVHVYFEQPMKNVVTQDAKITLAGMVSNIGGTLGIFLGLSMVTLFDECFQIFKYIRDFFRQKKSLPI